MSQQNSKIRAKLNKLVRNPNMFLYDYFRKRVDLDASAASAATHKAKACPHKYVGIWNVGGTSLKDYAVTHDMPELIRFLKTDLDAQSCEAIDRLVDRAMHIPDERRAKFYIERSNTAFRSDEERERHQKAHEFHMEAAGGNKRLAKLNANTFYYAHGLRLLPSSVHEYVKGGDFLDLGAYVGDSAYVLHQYEPKAIYSFDISLRHINDYQALMLESGITNAELFQLALSNEDGTIQFSDSGSGGNNIHSSGETIVKKTTIDKFVAKHDLAPSLIKVDVEGEDLNALIGAEGSIRKNRPVLLWSIYHNAEQFFKTKPLIDSWGLNYKHKVRQLHSSSYIGDTCLLSYPAELDPNE